MSVTAGSVTAGVLAAAAALRAELAGFEPAGLSGAACAELVEALGATEKACAGARVRAAARAVAQGAHRGRGFAEGAEWLAAATGGSAGEARVALQTAGALDACPQTAAALAAGEVSLAQAAEIARTQAEVPGAEAELVALARRSGLGAVRDQARARRLGAADPEELHRRQHRARTLRHWRDGDGMVCLAGALAPEVGVALVNRLDAVTDRLRRAGRRAGASEPRAAYAADALVALSRGSGPAKAARAEVVIVCDLRAYRRGHAHPGEPSHLIGGGPIPAARVRGLADDAFVKAVLHDGVRIHTVAHLGRHIPSELRSALELGPPPGFDGAACVEAGCGRRYGLEWDHVNPLANRGPTSYDNLVARCWPHHRDKTERDRQAGLLGRAPPRAPP